MTASSLLPTDRLVDTINIANVRYQCLSNKYLELIVLPTEQCNFRCTYCYEDFKIGNMSVETTNAVVKLIENRKNNLQHLHISYFGGEPLMNMRAIIAISEAAKRLEEKGHFKLTSGATTNGYMLNKKNFNKLIDLNCRFFQISLDGWREQHNKTRIKRFGGGSFDVIWQNLLMMKNSSHDFQIMLRVHMMPDNTDSLRVLLHQINSTFNDSRFSVALKKVGNWGGKNENHPTVFGRESVDFESIYRSLQSMVFNLADGLPDEVAGSSAHSRNTAAVDEPINEPIPYVCYASKANSFVIRSNGRLNKCTVALSSPKNDIGKINPDGTLSVESSKFAPWIGGLANLDKDYMGCPAGKVLFDHAD